MSENKGAKTECIEGIGRITIMDLWNVLRRLSLKAIGAFFVTFVAYTSAVYTYGYNVARKDSAITLFTPFNIRMSVTEKDMKRNENGVLDCTVDNLSIIKPGYVPKKEHSRFIIFREYAPTQNSQVGEIACIGVENKPSLYDSIRDTLFSLSDRILTDTAFAQQFSLGVHLNDVHYTQSFVAADTIRRTYSDGCVLQYKVDRNGNSILQSYVWIVYKHK